MQRDVVLHRHHLFGRQHLYVLRVHLGRIGIDLESAPQRIESVFEHHLGGDHVLGGIEGARLRSRGRFVLTRDLCRQEQQRVVQGDGIAHGVAERTQPVLDLFELLGRRVISAVEPIGAGDMREREPVERCLGPVGPDRDDGLDPRRVQERVAEIVAVELE